MALVKGQQYTPQEIYAEDPGWLKQNSPQIYENITKGLTLPTQQVQSGQLGIQQQQAQLPGQQAQSNVEVATQQPKIQTAIAGAAKETNDAAQLSKIAEANRYFSTHHGKDGKVSPQDYNKFKQEYAGLNGNAEEFDDKFAQNYVNPNNIWYDIPDNISVRSSLPALGQLVKSYAGLENTGPTWEKLASVPVIKDYLLNGDNAPLKKNAAYASAVQGLTGKLLELAGAGQGSTIRGSMSELNRVAGLLPGPFDSKEKANDKLSELDNLLKSTYGTSLDDWLNQ